MQANFLVFLRYPPQALFTIDVQAVQPAFLANFLQRRGWQVCTDSRFEISGYRTKSAVNLESGIRNQKSIAGVA